MKTVALDVDETLVAFAEPFIEVCKKKGIHLTVGKIWNFFDQDDRAYSVFNELDKDFWITLPRIKKSLDLDIIPVAYISHRLFPERITEQSLHRLGFPKAPVFHVKHTEEKVKIIKQLGVDVYVDDRSSTVMFCQENGIEAYLLDQPWNADFTCLPRIKTLGELNDICQ